MFLINSDADINALSQKQKINEKDEYFFVDLITEAIIIQKNNKIVHCNKSAVDLFVKFKINFEMYESFYTKLNLVISERTKDLELVSEVNMNTSEGETRKLQLKSKFSSGHNDSYEVIQIVDITKMSEEIESRIDLALMNKENELEDMRKDILDKKLMLEMDIQNNKNKTDFFSDISHELRTPINILLSSIQLMEIYTKDIKSDKSKAMKKYLCVMKQNGYRLLRLVNNFLDITKIEAGYYVTNLNKHNIVEIVEEITQSVVDYIKHRDVEIIFDTDAEEMNVYCDEDKIERIMLNLLANAMKYTSSGGKIEVVICSREEEVDILIKDNGQGIPKDKIDFVFDRFSQVNKGLTKKLEGTGIGLAIVKNFVEMQYGKIAVTSKIDEGTEFKITFPVVATETEDDVISANMRDRKSEHIEKMNVEFSDIYAICDEN